MDLAEIAPTVQCITSNFEDGDFPPYTNDILKHLEKEISFDTFQSEEGGRFYKESNRNLIVKKDYFDSNNEIKENYIWMNMYQLSEFMKFNNYINIEARSLISGIPCMKI